MLPDIQPGNTKILYFFNCLLDGMHTIFSLGVRLFTHPGKFLFFHFRLENERCQIRKDKCRTCSGSSSF